MNIKTTFPLYLLIISILLLINPLYLLSEVIYLKDGQILNAEIIKEDTSTITIKTKYQTMVINRDTILRIMYGERQAETIYLLLNDNTLIKGFLVDQDANKVVIRRKKESTKEETFEKKNIKQMSPKEIFLYYPGIPVMAGLLVPLGSGGGNLNPSFYISGGIDIRFPWQFPLLERGRLQFEVGISNCTSNENKNLSFFMLPISGSFIYRIPYKYFMILPKFGLGASLISFNDGEGGSDIGVVPLVKIGIGVSREIITKKLFITAFLEYIALIEGAPTLHNIIQRLRRNGKC
jgi:hypothetical protein